MTNPITRDSIYRRRVFDAKIIELRVRWSITYLLSFRGLVGIMADSLDPSLLPGASTRATFPFEANGITGTKRSTSTERLWIGGRARWP